MPGSIANPRVWVGADVATAPLGSTYPATPTEELDAAWQSAGLLSEDGLTITPTETSTPIFAYGGIHVRTPRSKFQRELKFVCLEDNLVVFGLANPGSTATTSGGITTRDFMIPVPNPVGFILTLKDGNVNERKLIQKGEVIGGAPITITDAGLTVFELTVNVYASADGRFYRTVSDDPQQVVA